MILCHLCATLESRAHRRYEDRGPRWCPVNTHQPRLENGDSSIRTSAENGCYFCLRFWNSLSVQHREVILDPEFSGLIVSLYWNAKEERFTQLHFVMGFEFDECDGDVTDTFDLIPTTPGPDTAAQLNSINIVPYWLRHCVREHTDCVSEPPEWLPTRLIDLGDTVDRATARIVHTEDLTLEHCPYLTLSHGALLDKSTSLTAANLQSFQRQLVLTELPELVQLAVQATKTFKLRYLWIEELCIVQDSSEDMSNETLDIGRIYANSRITITTSSLHFMRQVLQGTCKRRPQGSPTLNLMHDQAFGCSLKTYMAVQANIWASEIFESHTARNSAHFLKQFSLQRNLHFGATQLYWKCKSLLACEMLPNGDPRGLPRDLLEEANDLIARQRNKVEELEDKLWGRLVENYTRQLFEDPRTRLARFSPYAEELANTYSLSYFAGLWGESLIADLLWYVDGTPTSRPKDYCAPSWSWASVTGAVTYIPSSDLVGNCYVTIKDIHTNLLDRSIGTGAVVGGYIYLHGYLIEIPTPTFFCIRGLYVAGCFYPDDPSDITEDKYYCLPVHKQLTPQGIWLCGLVLHRMENSRGIEYRRAGLFRCREGDALHLLGKRVRGKAGRTFYSYEAHVEKGVDGKPFAAEITIV